MTQCPCIEPQQDRYLDPVPGDTNDAAMDSDQPKVIDLFSGCGGFSLGAHQAGFSVPLAVDIDGDLSSSYALNFPETEFLQRDLASFSAREALKEIGLKVGEICGVIGGPPCQGFSSIGHQNPDDERNQLLKKFCEFVAEARPAFFVMETEPNMLAPQFSSLLDEALSPLRERYEISGPVLVNAAEYGAATRRRRVVFIGADPNRMNVVTEVDIVRCKSIENNTVRDAIIDLPSPAGANVEHYWAKYPAVDADVLSSYASRARALPSSSLGDPAIVNKMRQEECVSGLVGTRHTKPVIDRWSKVEPGGRDAVSRATRLHWDQQCNTLRAGTGRDRGSFQAVRPIHPEEDRVITVREAARLQGFPDWFQFHHTKWHSFRMIGNSVSPCVSLALLSLVRDAVVDAQMVSVL